MRKKPDILGAGGIARAIAVHDDTALVYCKALWSRRAPGILKADNGQFFATPEGMKAIKRFARIPRGQKQLNNF